MLRFPCWVCPLDPLPSHAPQMAEWAVDNNLHLGEKATPTKLCSYQIQNMLRQDALLVIRRVRREATEPLIRKTEPSIWSYALGTIVSDM